jgi:predicted translin family RNA/ssDNA-binding protein
MLKKNFFDDLKKSYTYFNETRRLVINTSGDALHKSKIAIFSMHRGKFEEGMILLKEVETALKSLEAVFKKSPALRYEGSYKAALEEYTEAKLFSALALKGELIEIKEVQIDFDTYLAGLCDATGEMVRLAIKEATAGKIAEVHQIKELVTEIMGELIEFNLTSYLRTKHDQAKTNLRKLEQMIYEITLRTDYDKKNR